jgi:serine/threonine protein kinase
MVWRFVEGKTLEQFLSGMHSIAQLQDVCQQVERAISAMHAHGIVHGAVHARNIIIDPSGRVILTHVSPLLWNDPRADLRALAELSAQILPPSGEGDREDEHKSSLEMDLRRRLYISAAGAILAGFLIFIAVLWYIRA